MERQHSPDEFIDHCVVDALRYVSTTLVALAPAAVTGSSSCKGDAQYVLLDMRRRIPEATRFICVQIFARLRVFAREADRAFHEERKPDLPKPRTDVDFTVRAIWDKLNAIVEAKYIAKADWKPVTWNPYHDLHRSIATIVKHVAEAERVESLN